MLIYWKYIYFNISLAIGPNFNFIQIEAWMDLAAKEFKFVEKFQVGITYEGRPIYALQIRGSGSANNPSIYVDSLIHSREWISGAASMFLMKQV